jgi:type IV secretory pathway VirJ component
MARTGAKQAILVGQSFGADIARVGLAHLPESLRERVAGVVLVVPGETAFFRADPTGLSYRGTPDAGAAEASSLDWTPLICIRGANEKDSLCPLLIGDNVRKLVLPGGHLLDRNQALLSHAIVSALGEMLKQVRR